MKKIGSFMAIIGIAAIIFGLLGRVPKLLFWIYNWGETTAWIIKLGLTIGGGALYFLSPSEEEDESK